MQACQESKVRAHPGIHLRSSLSHQEIRRRVCSFFFRQLIILAGSLIRPDEIIRLMERYSVLFVFCSIGVYPRQMVAVEDNCDRLIHRVKSGKEFLRSSIRIAHPFGICLDAVQPVIAELGAISRMRLELVIVIPVVIWLCVCRTVDFLQCSLIQLRVGNISGLIDFLLIFQVLRAVKGIELGKPELCIIRSARIHCGAVGVESITL